MKYLFKNKHLNHEAINNNFVMLLLYHSANPTSLFLAWLSISPNAITSLSIIFSLVAFLFLILNLNPLFFIVFWFFSIHLDFCDGTVARMTNKQSKNAFNYDHMSDIFKIFLIFLGVGIKYNSLVVWVLTSTSIFSFLFMSILNHDYSSFSVNLKSRNNYQNSLKKESELKRNIKKLLRFPVLIHFSTIFFTINAHTLLGFFIFPLGEKYAITFLSYFSIISIFLSIRIIKKLIVLKV